jgi:peroxisomal membrane protein 2
LFATAGIPWVFIKDKIKKDFTSVQVAAWKVQNINANQCYIFDMYADNTARACRELIKIMIFCELQVGPVVAWVNNQFVPLQLRVIFQCFVGLCWYICPQFTLIDPPDLFNLDHVK